MKGNWGSRSRLPPSSAPGDPLGKQPTPKASRNRSNRAKGDLNKPGLSAWTGQKFLVLFDESSGLPYSPVLAALLTNTRLALPLPCLAHTYPRTPARFCPQSSHN